MGIRGRKEVRILLIGDRSVFEPILFCYCATDKNVKSFRKGASWMIQGVGPSDAMMQS